MVNKALVTVDPLNTIGSLRNPIVADETGILKAPDNIITSVAALKSIYYQMRSEHLKRIELYAGIEGLIAGDPPYDPIELAKDRLSHISNFNNLDARADYEEEANAYWNLLNEAETLCEFEIRDSAIFQGALPGQLQEWADTMGRHWNDVVRSWTSFNVVFNTLVAQLVKLGISPCLWPDERDWRWRTIELSRFFVPDQAQSDIDMLTCVCVETIFTAQYLWEVYNKFKDLKTRAKANCPWDTDELGNLLLHLANQMVKNDQQYSDVMEIQKRLQNGDLSLNAVFSDDIRMISAFYKEYDGSFSHYMFHPLWDTGRFVYFAPSQYKCLEDGLIIFTASPGEMTIHSNRGLGHKIYSSSQAMMQLDCSMIDMARMSSTPLIQTVATGTKDAEAIRFYPGIPTNLGQATFVENTLGENIAQIIQASNYIQSKIRNNMATSGDDPGIPDRDTGSKSAPEARMQSYREFAIPKTNIAHFYTQFDRVVQNMTIKLLNSRKGYPGYDYSNTWKERCIADGVPAVMFKQTNTDMYGLPSHIKVQATRVAGDGSTLAKLLGLQELQDLVPSMGPNEQLFYKKQKVLAALGPRYVKGFTQDSVNTASVSQDASVAGTENGIMRLGESPVFSPANEHRAHMVTHMALANDTIRRIQQQQLDPNGADTIFTVLVPHMAEHWGMLVKNQFAQNIVAQLRAPWTQVQKYAVLNRHNAAKALQAQIKQKQAQAKKTAQSLNDNQLKTLQTQTNIANANKKVQSQVDRAQEASQTKANIMQQDVENKSSNQRLKITLEAANKKSLTPPPDNIQSDSLDENRQELADINGVTPAPFDIEGASE